MLHKLVVDFRLLGLRSAHLLHTGNLQMAQSCCGADGAVVHVIPMSARCKCMSQVRQTGAEDLKHFLQGPSKQVELQYRRKMHGGKEWCRLWQVGQA